MDIRKEISRNWKKFRAIAGVDVVVDGIEVEAVLADSIRAGISQDEDSSAKVRRTRIAIRDFDWEATVLGMESEVFFKGKRFHSEIGSLIMQVKTKAHVKM